MMSSKLFLDRVGEVILSVDSTGISWKQETDVATSCLGKRPAPPCGEANIEFSNIYGTKMVCHGLINLSTTLTPGSFKDRCSEMHRFTVHGVKRSKTHPSVWGLAIYTFGHTDLRTCLAFVNHINSYLTKESGRPKRLLIFVNPHSGKGKGQKTWDVVAPIFSNAQVRTKVIVTERAGHAFDVMAAMTNQDLNTYDGVIAVGGDGVFNEILNGLLSSRLKAPYPPVPPDFIVLDDNKQSCYSTNDTADATPHESDDQSPLLPTSNESDFPYSRADDTARNPGGQSSEFCIPNQWFRFGLIPAGSTDAIVICTTGVRDPTTSALQIVLGKRINLDIAQVVKWSTTTDSKDEPSVRYTASFAGYGFYGDVIMESEKYRWMGPKRYDIAGTQVFLRRRSYEAEVSYLELNTEQMSSSSSESKAKVQKVRHSERVICRTNCSVCNSGRELPLSQIEKARWASTKGRFLSVGAAVISCRNGKAPDGLVADAHLSDGFLHLILIKECSRPCYLGHLLELARKGGNPLNFKFIEHHKTTTFSFTSVGEQGVWNLDGEVLRANKLSAQVFRGLVSLFATGPEV